MTITSVVPALRPDAVHLVTGGGPYLLLEASSHPMLLPYFRTSDGGRVPAAYSAPERNWPISPAGTMER